MRNQKQGVRRWYCLGLVLVWVGAAPAQQESDPVSTEAGEAVTVSLRPVARAAEAVVTVADVATLEGGSAALREQVACLDVAEMPPGQDRLWVLREQVSYRLQLAGIDPQLVCLVGASKVLVTVAPAEVSESGCLAAARKMVQGRLSWDPADVAVKLVRPVAIPKLALASGDRVRLEAEFPQGAQPLGQIRVEVAVRVNGQRQAVVPVYLDVQLHQVLAVASRRIEPGELLGPANVQSERRAVAAGGRFLAAQEALTGKRATRVLVAGQAIAAADVEAAAQADPVLVRPRDTVRLVACVGPLQVVAAAEALQEGRAGQMVRVRNVDSNHVVLGRVVGPGVVEVEY